MFKELKKNLSVWNIETKGGVARNEVEEIGRTMS